MNLIELLFYFFILVAGGFALAILFSRNVFQSAMYLLVSLLAVAALYVLAFAEFLAVAQILIYAGGITVIIIFGIMLTTRISGKQLVVKHTHLLSGALAAIVLFVILVQSYLEIKWTDGSLKPLDISAIGVHIFSLYVLPFEVAGILLLIALIGAAVVTSHLKSKV